MKRMNQIMIELSTVQFGSEKWCQLHCEAHLLLSKTLKEN